MRYELSDYEWAATQPRAPWRDLPDRFGPLLQNLAVGCCPKGAQPGSPMTLGNIRELGVNAFSLKRGLPAHHTIRKQFHLIFDPTQGGLRWGCFRVFCSW